MSLQTKFAILLAALGSAVLVALAAAWWSLDVTYREVRGPVESSSNVVSLLIEIEAHIDELRGLAEPSDAFRTSPAVEEATEPRRNPPELTESGYRTHATPILALLKQISAAADWNSYAGKNATKTLHEKIWILRLKAATAFAAPDLAPAREAPEGMSDQTAGDASIPGISNQLFQIHELIKRMERRVVEDIQKLAVSGADLRARLFVVLGLALLLVALTGGLALLLIRRWIVNPVSNLRTAAARIASGDFDYRVPILASSRRDEIIALSTEVNHMAGMVKQLQSERIEQERLAAVGEMVRRLAHNLRNPLAGIRGLAELTRSEVAPLGSAADDVRETQGRIITAVDRFEGWLSDLLNVTKPAQIHVEPTTTNVWLAGLVEAHRPLALTRGVDLKLDQSAGPVLATFDARHLEHAVSAILSNAIEAAAASQARTRPGSVRVVSRACENGQPSQIWELRIEDTGPGVPPDLRETIFKPYFTTKKDGNGIGLAVAQQVVRAHGGRITVEEARSRSDELPSEPRPAGAAFIIRLPVHGRPEGNSAVARIGQ
jgi:signal transduction histidine kinase